MAAEEAWADERERVHHALHRVPIDELVSPRTGDLVARVVSDTATIKTFVQSVIPTAITLVSSLAATAIVLAVVEFRLLLIVAVPVPIVVTILFVLRRRIATASHRLLDRQADLHGVVTESVHGREAIRAYGAAPMFDDRVARAGEAMRVASLELERDQAALYPVTNLVLSLALLGVLAGGGYYAINGAISVGGLVVTYFYLARALGPIRGANSVLFGWQRTVAALSRIDDLVSSARGDQADALPHGHTLVADAVDFSWTRDPEQNAVSAMALSAPAGSRIAVIGPSGAGKSTAARLILGLIAPHAGQLTFGDAPTASFESADRAGIAYLGQDPFIFRGSLRDNIVFGRDIDDAQCERAARIARVSEFADARGGLELELDEQARNLSGGQRKRVALARALAANPDLLVIDQLATDLEAELVDAILDDLRLGTDATIIYFGHAVPEALQPTMIYRVEGGRFTLMHAETDDVLASG